MLWLCSAQTQTRRAKNLFFTLCLFISGRDSLNYGKYHNEYRKYDRHRRCQSDLPVYRTGLINIINHRVCGMGWSSSRHNHWLYQHPKRSDRYSNKYEYAKRLQLRQSNIFKLLPGGCMIHICRLVQRRVDRRKPPKKIII